MRRIHVIMLIFILLGASWLTVIVDDGLGTVWTYNVVRNWEQYGFFHLHGKLVYNPGGYQADTHPLFYAGHSPVGLYPFFLVQNFFPAPGAMIYYALVAAVVMLSIWQLLGRTSNAFWLAGIAVLTPGYLRWQTTLDPNLAAVMVGFPFCAIVIWLLKEKPLKIARIILLFGIIILYSTINWSTVFIQGMLFATLLLLRVVPGKNIAIYLVLVVVPALAIVTAGVVDKMTNAHSGPSMGLAHIFKCYGWGNEGYGLDLTTKTAFLRLLFANLVGLFPVIFFSCVELWRGRRGAPSQTTLLFLLPLFTAIMELAVLRNYFGHHPWMSCNFILLGMILSLAVWRTNRAAPAAAEGNDINPLLPWAALATVFAYTLVTLSFYHVHNRQELNLVKLIRRHTPRSASLLVAQNTDPALADMRDRLPEPFDRNLLVLNHVPGPGTGMTNEYWLTSVFPAPNGRRLVAQCEENGSMENMPLVKQLLGWFSRRIAHRRPGDKLDFGGHYYLYQ